MDVASNGVLAINSVISCGLWFIKTDGGQLILNGVNTFTAP